MAENSPEFCDICHRLDISKPAAEFCPQCGDLLCEVCQNHHKVAKLSNLHQTISLNEYKKLPMFITNINNKCSDHEGILEFYCKIHDMLCCKRCLISSHKDCNDTTIIEDLLSVPTFYQSSPLHDIEQILKYIGTNIHTAIDDRKRNLDEIRKQKSNLVQMIKEKRKEINNLLDLLEKTWLQQLSEVEMECHQKIERLVKDLKERSSKILQLQSDVALIKESASNLQIFMGIRELKESASSEEKHIKSLHCSGSLNNISIECIFDDQLKTLIENTKNLGKVEVKNADTEISFSWFGDKTAQLSSPRHIDRPFNDIKVKLVHNINTRGNVTGCAITPTGKILFTDYNYGMLKYDKNGDFETRITVQQTHAFSLAVVDENTVAISGGGWGKNLYLSNINNGSIIKMVDMRDWCFGVSIQNGSYIVCTNGSGIKIRSSSKDRGTQTRSLSGKSGKDSYIASCQNFIVHTDFQSDNIKCFNFKGKLLWTYQDSTLRKPCGITVDSDFNIYVAGSESNNIVLISPDGVNTRQLLDSSHGILDPRAIYFDKKDNVLLVANFQGSAFVYAVS